MAVLPPLPHPHPSKKAKQINAFKFTIILVIQSVYFKTHRQALENHSKPCTQQAHSFPVPLADPPTHPQGQNVQQSLTGARSQRTQGARGGPWCWSWCSLSLPPSSSFILSSCPSSILVPSRGFDAPRDTDVPRSAAVLFKTLAEGVSDSQTL